MGLPKDINSIIGKINGIAGINEDGKIIPMPNSEDIGSISSSATIELIDTTQNYNLNNYWTPGQVVFISQDVIDADVIANCPSKTSGIMHVDGTSKLGVQTYIEVVSGTVYSRHKALSTGNMSGWNGVSGIVSETTSNGFYIKWPDGTMMAYGIVTSMTIPANGTGAISTDTLLFPTAFLAPPTMTLTLLADTSTGLYAKLGNVSSNLWWGSVTNTGSTERTVKIHWHAIGRWK